MSGDRPAVCRLLDAAESALVRYSLERPGAIASADETTLRYAFSLARLIGDRDGARLPQSPHCPSDDFTRAAGGAAAALFGPNPWRVPARPEPELIAAAARRLWGLALSARSAAAGLAGLSLEALDGRVRQRQLVLALGGGGGCAYVYLGCFALLEEWKLTPSLIAGTSMGAILGLFRARRERFEIEELERVLGQLSYRKLFRESDPPALAPASPTQTAGSRYALPGPFRLFLRSALGSHFATPNVPRLDGLALPLVVAVTGIRPGMLPRPLEDYERLLTPRSLFPPTPEKLRRKGAEILSALAELVTQPHRLSPVYLGADRETQGLDALDAVGFSSSLPGVIHYDVLRDDSAVHRQLAAFLHERDLAWLADGGLVENCPARAAFVGARRHDPWANPLVLALDGFSPKLSTPAWLPLQRLAHENVRRALPWASLYIGFDQTLSPLELVPRLTQARRALALGRTRLATELPLLARLLTPLQDLTQSRPAAA